MFESRNNPLGFAQRTSKNLKYVNQAFEQGGDVHLVTHVVNSLLGIVIVPEQNYSGESFMSIPLEKLYLDRGWPRWNIPVDNPISGKSKTETLGDLMWHLRNATAHGRFWFGGESDSRQLSEVELVVEDAPSGNQVPNWRAYIGGSELYQFCVMLADYIDDSIG